MLIDSFEVLAFHIFLSKPKVNNIVFAINKDMSTYILSEISELKNFDKINNKARENTAEEPLIKISLITNEKFLYI